MVLLIDLAVMFIVAGVAFKVASFLLRKVGH